MDFSIEGDFGPSVQVHQLSVGDLFVSDLLGSKVLGLRGDHMDGPFDIVLAIEGGNHGLSAAQLPYRTSVGAYTGDRAKVLVGPYVVRHLPGTPGDLPPIPVTGTPLGSLVVGPAGFCAFAVDFGQGKGQVAVQLVSLATGEVVQRVAHTATYAAWEIGSYDEWGKWTRVVAFGI